MSDKIVELENVSVALKGVPVLEHVNFTVESGDFIGIIGPNGAGKTTLLKVLLGLLKPTEGSVRMFGAAPGKVRGAVGYVPQYTRFDTDFPISVFDVVLMGRLNVKKGLGSYTEADREVARAALGRVEMVDYSERQIGKLSSGQLQRVLIARALAGEPKLLLLDEPTASLDSKIGRGVYELLAELSQSMSIILVSHDIGVISSYVKTIACLNRRMHYHHSKEISGEVLQEIYGCPVDLIAHGHAHRVLGDHSHGEHE